MNNFENIGVFKCKEEHLTHNLKTLCQNGVETLANISGVIGKGDYFYIPIKDKEQIKGLNLIGYILKNDEID